MGEGSQRRTGLSQRRPILRVRTGCLTCRARKKKCDEVKPTCAGCRRNKLSCEWPTTSKNKKRGPGGCIGTSKSRPESQPEPEAESGSDCQQPPQEPADVPRTTQPDLGSIHVANSPVETVVLNEPSPCTAVDADSGTVESRHDTQDITFMASSPDGVSSPADSGSSCGSVLPLDADVVGEASDGGFPPNLLLDLEPDSPPLTSLNNESTDGPAPWDLIQFPLTSDSSSSFIPRSMSLWPGEGGLSYDLLSYYLSRTALSMGNGSTDVNPFISQVIPLAFANKFILDLVICQSAVHRATENVTQQAVAQKHYNSSLRQFQKSIDEYIHGKEISPLWIGLGALIMCFTETAKGDVNGVVFDHMNAAGPLISSLVSRTGIIPGDLKNFIIEYYVDVTTITMISIDPAFGSAPFLSPEFENLAEQMVAHGYVGHLCGCWLELLLLFPRIFTFSQHSSVATPDDFVAFSEIQSQILSFKPSTMVGNEVALAGHIFKEATHIYLLTSIDVPQPPTGKVKEMVDNSITNAFAYLDELAPTARINTSLCWALAVIGSCLDDESRRQKLRERLQVMFLTIGLGNIQGTLALLEKLWMSPTYQRTPWVICRAMCDHEMWISFA